MKFSEQWLRDWVDLSGVSTEDLVYRLTMAGLEVDRVDPVAGEFENVVVARIQSCKPHPNADKLSLCEVDDGSGELLQVVCGAPNAREGLVAPFARIGGVLPGDFRIKKAKLRGEASFGMLCSARELQVGDDASGLMELPEDAPVGESLGAYLNLDGDHTIEIDLTPNRGDCLGMVGLAQEVAAVFGRTLHIPDQREIEHRCDDTVEIHLEAPEDCPRYVGRVVRNIDPTAKTPLWMAERLRRSGLRPISPTVDITNYVLLELGQPLHAFDLERIEGSIIVRRGRAGEQLTLLSEDEVEVDERFLMIADESRALAVAGVMGGLESAVTVGTRHIFFESAFFNPSTIVGRARELGLHTDASHRFERGVDPKIQRRAIERATELLLDIAGGEPGPICEASAPELIPERKPVELRAERIGHVLGANIESVDVERILTGLGMSETATEHGWSVVPPSRRFDIEIEEDLIEEIARIHGYDRLPARSPEGAIPAVSMPEGRYDVQRAGSVLVDRGYSEAINYSFVGPDQLAPLGDEAFPLANPLSADLAVMRTSLIPGLLGNLAYNQHRQVARIRLFETGAAFPIRDGEVAESSRLAAVCCGPAAPEQWGVEEREVDFFDAKGDLEAILALTGDDDFRFVPSERDYLHPGQSADVYRGDTLIGWVGAIHPKWLESLEIKGAVFAFEIDLDALGDARIPAVRALSRYPSIRRDLAIIVPDHVRWRQIEDIVAETAGNLLTKLVVFDEYKGPGIDEGQKSVALGFVLQDETRTLTDQEVDAVVDSLVAQLEDRLKARLRA